MENACGVIEQFNALRESLYEYVNQQSSQWRGPVVEFEDIKNRGLGYWKPGEDRRIRKVRDTNSDTNQDREKV